VLGRRFVNTSPLVFLVRENLLEILREGVLEVVVPQTVIKENVSFGFGHQRSTRAGRGVIGFEEARTGRPTSCGFRSTRDIIHLAVESKGAVKREDGTLFAHN